VPTFAPQSQIGDGPMCEEVNVARRRSGAPGESRIAPGAHKGKSREGLEEPDSIFLDETWEVSESEKYPGKKVARRTNVDKDEGPDAD
jgi:hypothetical protein